MFFLILFHLLSQMKQMNSYHVRGFGNPSFPTALAKRFTTSWVTKSS